MIEKESIGVLNATMSGSLEEQSTWRGSTDRLRGRFRPQAEPVRLAPQSLLQLQQNQSQLSLVKGSVLASGTETAKTIYVTSCFQGEGKSMAALSAAYGLVTTSNANVLLIDTNPKRSGLQMHFFKPALPNQPAFFAPAAPGWTEVLAGKVAVEAAVRTSDVGGLHYLPAGSPDHVIDLEGKAVKALLDSLEPCYDYIIIDGTSVFAGSDALGFTSLVDGFVFVVRCEQTRWEVVQEATSKIRGLGGHVIGGVLNQRKYYIPKRIYHWLTRS